jgi:hypothetical protein
MPPPRSALLPAMAPSTSRMLSEPTQWIPPPSTLAPPFSLIEEAASIDKKPPDVTLTPPPRFHNTLELWRLSTPFPLTRTPRPVP